MCLVKVDRWPSIDFRLDYELMSGKIVETELGFFESLLTLIQV